MQTTQTSWKSGPAWVAAALLLAPAGARGAQEPQDKPPAATPAEDAAAQDSAAAQDPAAAQDSAEAEAARRAELEALRAAEAARLRAEYLDALTALQQATASYQNQVRELVARGQPREAWPPHPNAVFYARFEALALQDQPDALRWCLGGIGLTGMPLPEMAERKHELYARLVVVHPDLPWMADCARWIQAEGSPAGLGAERADALLAALAEGTQVPATRAAALGARATLLAARNDPAARAEHLRILRELVARHADSPAGLQARGALFQLESLVVGKELPDVEATDTDGRAFKLSDYRGKVVVLEFWGFW